jgi:hypothetical protein
MGFWIKYDAGLGPVEYQLALNPMEVEYPEQSLKTVLTSANGNIVIQRPLRDSRARKLIWRGYGPNHATFAAMWTLLESMDTRKRRESGLAPTVGIWEDVSGSGGFARMDGSSKLYTTVRVVSVDRQTRQGGGPVAFDSTLTFHIDDESYTNF